MQTLTQPAFNGHYLCIVTIETRKIVVFSPGMYLFSTVSTTCQLGSRPIYGTEK